LKHHIVHRFNRLQIYHSCIGDPVDLGGAGVLERGLKVAVKQLVEDVEAAAQEDVRVRKLHDARPRPSC